MKINLHVSNREEYFEKFLLITSALAPSGAQLTSPEILLLSKFMALPESMHYYPFSPKAKKAVNSKLAKPLSIQSMSLRLCGLIDKKYLIRDDDNFINYSPQLKLALKSQSLDVNLQHRSSDKASS